MDVFVLKACEKEMKLFPDEVVKNFLDAVAKLSGGLTLSMPLSRTMPSVGKNIHELRFKDKAGIFRVFYVIRKKDAIYVVHAFKKKTMKTPKKNIDLIKKRIGRIENES